MQIRKIRSAEVEEALALAYEVFMEFEAPDYGQEGVDSFRRDVVENERFIARCRQGECPIYAAFDGDRMMGMMGLRAGKAHISMAFVKREYQRQGVATAIFQYLLADILKKDPALREVTLNASPYGMPFYLHIGFEPRSEEQEQHGIRFTPMKYLIPSR